jgi:alkylated DNA repair dioxygenase AlkB
MDSLFPISVATEDVPPIPGLRYVPHYVSSADEAAFVAAINRAPWNTEWNRRRQSYGSSYGSSRRTLPIPKWGLQLAQRLFEDGVTPVPFDHMLVNEYEPGQGIAMHRDYAPFGATVVSISLLSPCVMDFRQIEPPCKEQLLLERHSLLVLSDTARYEWQHGIAARKTDIWNGIRIQRSRRLSITFRFRVD